MIIFSAVFAAMPHYKCFFNCCLAINMFGELKLKKVTKSLLEELNSISSKRDKEAIIESRATHVINSAINLLALIKENYNETDAGELERRLLNSIKGSDPNKFSRGIRKLKETKTKQ